MRSTATQDRDKGDTPFCPSAPDRKRDKREYPLCPHALLLAVGALVAVCMFGAAPAYAVEVPSEITVQFWQGIGIIGRLPGASSDLMVYEAFAEAGASVPLTDDESETLKGWATSPDAAEAMPNSMKLSEAYKQAGVDGLLRLYPVFGPAEKPHLSFYGQDGTTLLLEADIDSWQTIADAQVASGVSLLEDDASREKLIKPGFWFAGWSDEDGTLRYGDEPLVEDMSLFPSYAKLSETASGMSKVTVDVSEAYLLQPGLEKALSAGFGLEVASATADSLISAAKVDGYKPFNSYSMRFGYTDKEETTLVRQGFGQVTALLPTELATNTEVRVYWLKNDATVGKTVAAKVAKGGVSLSFSDYGISGKGNVLVAYKAPSGSSSSGSSAGKGSSPGSTSDGWKDVSSSSAGGKKKTSSGPSVASRQSAAPTSSYSRPQATVTAPSTTAAPSYAQQRTPATGSSVLDQTIRSNQPAAPSSMTGATTDPMASSVGSEGRSTAPTAQANAASKYDGEESSDASAPPGLGEREAMGRETLQEKSPELGIDAGNSATATGALETRADAPATKMGSSDGGVFYGACMLVIGALAVLAWQFAVRREKRKAVLQDEVPLFEGDL